MRGLPIFFEALQGWDTAKVSVVQMVRQLLFSQGVAPLPFASSLEELQGVLASLKGSGHRLGLFVINTYGAERLLDQLDEPMGETPVLFFRREIVWLQQHIGGKEEGPGVTAALGRMRPRLTSIWYYGGANCERIARKAAFRIEKFLQGNDFRRLENSVRLEKITPDQLEKMT